MPVRTPVRTLALMLALATAGPAAAAPDEAGYGAAGGYPGGHRGNWWLQQHLVGSLSDMGRLFPLKPVPTGPAANVRPLPAHPGALDKSLVQDYLDQHPATGLLVLKDGRILAEHYQYGRNAEHRFTSFSMAKTVVGMAVGIALAEGRIASVDTPVDKLEPALADTAWAGVPLRRVLQMSSGVQFDETYDRPGSDIQQLSLAWTQQRGSLLAGVQRLKARDGAAGERFHYASADTQVLGLVLRRATGRPLADYVAEKLWQPMGAEADAGWVTDAGGTEAAYCCLSARLRDWGRLGLLLAEGGQRDGRAIIPADWVHTATSAPADEPQFAPRRATPYLGYGYQTWVLPDGLGFALLGIRGQAVYVHPRLKLVMAQTAVWPQSLAPELARMRDQFWRRLVRTAAAL